MTYIAAADERLLLWISGLAGKFPPLDSFIRVVVNDYFIPVSLSLALMALWFTGQTMKQREKYQLGVAWAAASLGIACGFVKIINLFYYRPRPFEEMPELIPQVANLFYCPIDPSFPSNAAAITFAIATAVWLVHRKAGVFLGFLAFLMCLARVYAGVHYPLDIISGAAIGIVTAYSTAKIVFPLLNPLVRLFFWTARKLCLA